uniref:hypothetical protein n=1 Tax=Gemmiger formicilis TaxID=745368 RepID=UPI003FF0325F
RCQGGRGHPRYSPLIRLNGFLIMRTLRGVPPLPCPLFFYREGFFYFLLTNARFVSIMFI